MDEIHKMVLKDPYDRPITNIRISLTPRCNLKCIYCHREGEVKPEAELSKEQVAEILRVAAKFGIRSVKFTGGEPLLRKDILDIVRSVPPGMESSMTTNGILLAKYAQGLKEAGMKRVNVSIDSINPETYRKITGFDQLDKVLDGMKAGIEAGLTPIKINMVVLEGINDHEIDDFLAYIRGNRNLVLQLIELMDFNACEHHSKLDGLENSLAARSRQIITLGQSGRHRLATHKLHLRWVPGSLNNTPAPMP
jgi:cyclic pyranopterin phosphate synthase